MNKTSSVFLRIYCILQFVLIILKGTSLKALHWALILTPTWILLITATLFFAYWFFYLLTILTPMVAMVRGFLPNKDYF